MASHYFNKQSEKCLQQLCEIVMSDEDDNLTPFSETSDENISSSDEEESDEITEDTSSRKYVKLSDNTKKSGNTKGICSSNLSSENDPMMETIKRDIEEYVVNVSSDEEDLENPVWDSVTGVNLKTFSFTEPNVGVCTQLYADYLNKTPCDFFELLVDDEIINMMVTETNRYAAQCKVKETAPKARIHDWYDTNVTEMKQFIGVLFWMGLCQFPSIESYWSKNVIYENLIKSVMSRNRFQLMLKMWHFSDNNNLFNDRLLKITPLLDKLVKNFQRLMIPNEAVYIYETLVPFGGRLSFRQYIKNKKHKFGIKLYKLCIEKGYIYNLLAYCGPDKEEGKSPSQQIVLTLADSLLNKRRTIYTDNYCTSIALAHALLKQNTHLVGTLRSNRKLNPKNVTEKNLKKGETEAAESNTGIVVQKWKDKRDVLTLSTKHTSELVKVTNGGKETEKPASVIDYNKHKAYTDLSDQMRAYSTTLRRGVKWYRKLAIELLAGTALVNAFVLHQEVANENMSITKFKEEVTAKLLGIRIRQAETSQENPQHILEDVGRNCRRRCVVCYEKLKNEHDRAYAQRKSPHTKLKCTQCDKNYCLNCFFTVHNATK